MKIVDANVLLYATNRALPQSAACLRWLATALGGGEPVGFAWPVLTSFVRIATKPAVFPRPLSIEEAFDVVDDWLAQPAAVVVAPTERHAATLRSLLRALGTAGNLVTDAHLAALAIEHGAEVVSCDRDFERFAGVRRIDPTTP